MQDAWEGVPLPQHAREGVPPQHALCSRVIYLPPVLALACLALACVAPPPREGRLER